MVKPKFGDIYRWQKGHVDITVMVIGPEIDPRNPVAGQPSHAIIHLHSTGALGSHARGVLGDYTLRDPHWTYIDE